MTGSAKIFTSLLIVPYLSACTVNTNEINEATTETKTVDSIDYPREAYATEIGTVNPNRKLLKESSQKSIFLKADKICQTYFSNKTKGLPYWSLDELKKLSTSLNDEYHTDKYNSVRCYEGSNGHEKDITKYATISFGDLCGRGLYEDYLGKKFDDIPKDILNLYRPPGHKLRIFDVRYGRTSGILDKNIYRINMYVDEHGILEKMTCW